MPSVFLFYRIDVPDIVFFRLDGKHVVFGQVKEGMDTVSLMESYGLHDGGTVKKIVITDCGELK